MSRSRRDDSGARGRRSGEERERARLEREARRAGTPPPPPAAQPDAAPPDLAHEPTHADPTPSSRPARTSRASNAQRKLPGARASGRAAPERGAADGSGSGRRKLGSPPPASGTRGGAARDAIRRIQPKPPAPPAAPAGQLGDETDRPIGIRRVRRPTRPIVTPPGDTPPGPARRRRISPAQRLVGLVGLGVLAIFVVGLLMLFQPFGSAEGDEVTVTIRTGASAGEIGTQLADAGVVSSGLLFRVRATLSGKRDSLRSGKHTLRKDMTYGNAIAALSKPDAVTEVKTVKVTIPEGRTRRETVAIAKKAGLTGDYLEASKRFKGALNPFRYDAPKGTRSLEGFLFPATYDLPVGAPARELVERQLTAFRDNFASVDLRRARRKNLTAYDVLIIASMVEREAQVAKERPLIAAVIYNRLKDDTPLGIDATTRYALNKPSGALTQSELDFDSPYNTRRRRGLPPTPVGNPGLSSLRAAAAPANVSFRYYVVKPGTCGEHVFANTLEEHNRNVARYGAARAQAGDKSPTTC